jgi:hypothetical protein
MRWAGYVACMGERRGEYRILVGKLDKKRPLGIRRSRWEDYIKLGLKAIVWECMDGVGQAQDRVNYWVVVDVVMNIWVL